MKISTFRAPRLQDAIHNVRTVLGAHASVIHMRYVADKSTGDRLYEIDASVDLPVPQRWQDQQLQQAREQQPLRVINADDSHPERPHNNIQNQASRLATSILAKNGFAVTEPHASQNEMTHIQEVIDSALQGLAVATGEIQADTVLALLVRELEKRIQIGEPIKATTAEPVVVGFVGPPGVGKSRLVTRLAEQSHQQGARVGLFAFGSAPFSAMDQLISLAERLSMPLEVVSNLEHVPTAMGRLRDDCDSILLHCTDGCIGDQASRERVRNILERCEPTRTMLVLGADASSRFAEEQTRIYESDDVTDLAITKLDMAVGLGSWFELLSSGRAPISYASWGAAVSDLSPADSGQLATAMLASA